MSWNALARCCRLGVLLGICATLLAATSAQARRIYALSGEPAPHLLAFDAAQPSVIRSDVAITGIAPGEVAQAIDVRAAAGELLLLAVAQPSGSAHLYRLDAGTGVASAPLALSADPVDTTAPFTAIAASPGVSIDVNPMVDRVRLVTTAEQNLRVNPLTGRVLTDTALSADEDIVGIAYTNPFPGAGTTLLYDYGWSNDKLFNQIPPNGGTLNVVGDSGIALDTEPDAGLDIATDGTAYLAGIDAGLARLHTVNLATGAATLVGSISDGGTPIRDIAVAENVIGLGAAVAAGSEGGTAVVDVVRAEPHGSATVDYATSDGSAVAGADYSATAGTLTFGPGVTTRTIAIPLAADATPEPAESLKLTLADARGVTADESNALLAGPVTATVTIAAQPDRDGDGRADASDNCADVANADQLDADGDGIGSACDAVEPCALAHAGTAGDDTITGTFTGDRITGAAGDDVLSGGLGVDCLDGGRGDDRLLGDAGDDRLRGRAGADVLRGGPGDDDLAGGGGRDRLSGGGGADLLVANGGRNRIKGGAGADRIRAVNHRRDRIDCGGGKDSATVDRGDRARRCEQLRRR